MQTRTGIFTATLAAVGVLGAPATATTQTFVADLVELNGSGVGGTVRFDVDAAAQTLRVRADVTGLVATLDDGSPALHVNHIHGRFDGDGDPRNSVTPTMADDANGDGFVDVFEGFPNYGDVLLSLEPDPTPASNHNGPFADADGRLRYDLTYDLAADTAGGGPIFSTVTGTDYAAGDLFPLDLREYVIHGGFVGAGFQNARMDAPTTGRTYIPTLPVAAAEIAPVPLPAGLVLMLSGLGGLAVLRRARRA